MYLRKLLLLISVDSEHYFKVHFVNECQNNAADDGYAVAFAFLAQNQYAKEEYQNQGKNYTYNGTNAENEPPVLASKPPLL